MAIEAVRRVADEGAYSNRLIPSLIGRSNLGPEDRGLASELAYGTLRGLLLLDAALAPLLDRPLRRAPSGARAALRVGAHQLLYTRIPPHAAVGETVAAAPPRARGFVNAVLRRLADEGWRPPEGADDGSISLRTGVAPWVVAELRALVGEEAEAAAAGIASSAGLTLRANPCAGPVEDLPGILAGAGHEVETGSIHARSLRLPGGDPRTLPGWEDGLFTVQDEASAWVVDVLDPRRGERVLDCTAGPGGKATDIACRAGTVVASDLSERRAGLVASSSARLGVDVHPLVMDATRPAVRPGFDRVLVDAPCSGLGSARRRPELLWRPKEEDLAALHRLQVDLVSSAAGLLRPGGLLVYSVCTFPRAETDEVVAEILDRFPGLRPDPFATPEGERRASARLWPHRHGTDAMFAARFVLGGSRP
ncbi:MAG TPA: transcription antitermination factor NusB [Actinomycetota bacterium]